jgi:hypothetical protein
VASLLREQSYGICKASFFSQHDKAMGYQIGEEKMITVRMNIVLKSVMNYNTFHLGSIRLYIRRSRCLVIFSYVLLVCSIHLMSLFCLLLCTLLLAVVRSVGQMIRMALIFTFYFYSYIVLMIGGATVAPPYHLASRSYNSQQKCAQ